MAALIAVASTPDWARASLVLVATLLVHAWVLDRVERVLIGEPAAPPRPSGTVSARLLAPPPHVEPAAEPVPPRVVTKPRARAAIPPPGPPAPAVVLPATTAAAERVPNLPAMEEDSTNTSEVTAPLVEDPRTQPTAAVNVEQPAAVEAATEAVEFDAAGSLLHSALAGLPAPTTMLPAAARYVYRTTNSELRLASGTTIVDWSLADDGRYRLRLATTTLGMTLLELESQGTVRAFGLAPERYVETRVRRGAAAANFDWEGRRITFSARTHEQPLADGVQDRLSFQFQLMLFGQAMPERFKAGRQTLLRIASRDDVANYRLRSSGRVSTHTGLGDIETIKVERIVERESDARIEVWLAPDLGWLPARLRFTDRHGRVTESVLESTSMP